MSGLWERNGTTIKRLTEVSEELEKILIGKK